MACQLGTRDSAAAMNPFMSQAPRPCRREPREVRVNGSLVHVCPSIGTTSVCPESTSPRSTDGPMLANRFALRPVVSGIKYERTPWSARKLRTQSISGRLESRETVGQATKRSSISTVGRADTAIVPLFIDHKNQPLRLQISAVRRRRLNGHFLRKCAGLSAGRADGFLRRIPERISSRDARHI